MTIKLVRLSYVIDSSSLIESWTRDHPPEVFEAFWIRLADLIAKSKLGAPEEVGREIARGDDKLHSWATDQDGFFRSIDEPQQVAVAEILRDHPRLTDNRKRSLGDPWVIALAKVHGAMVISDERAAPNSARPKIPDVCKAFSIDCAPLAEIARREGWRFK